MPVYLCQPGDGHPDPWRHGVQVFALPCKIESKITAASSGGGERNLVVASWTQESNESEEDDGRSNSTTQQVSKAAGRGTAQSIRRVRHAELLLVDDVCMAYNRYWLRLRWPGRKGGFAGYIAMGLITESPRIFTTHDLAFASGRGLGQLQLEDRGISEDLENDENREETGSMPPSEPGEMSSLICSRTAVMFPSSPTMRLLGLYDDGISPPVALAPLPTESVFCRICREGLHDDADEELPAAANDDDEAAAQDDILDTSEGSTGVVNPEGSTIGDLKGPVSPHPTYTLNQDAIQNPMLAPCECSGSMAFVHYMCVEQWRCRSRHPDAHGGLNCETCGAMYALPPPAQREVHMPRIDQDQDEWLEAMPPHVMQALRQPHLAWQIGAAVVRRRWLRPIAPVFMSPIVALYCRARRLLKKRGVARRRWACSLCRRRARWKCVRCLRSYYCSRHCQNVSWHIIHKHVCYKPVRFWWSVVVYGILLVSLFPGVRTDPLMYDLGLFAIPASFVITGILGGSAGIFVKKATGVDIRGRLLELAVVLTTLFLTVISWGLIQAFFGGTNACYGTLGSYEITEEDLASSISMVKMFQFVWLKPMKAMYLFLDNAFLHYSSAWIRRLLCDRRSLVNFFPLADMSEFVRDGKEGCFEHIPFADENFFLQENGGEKCAGDLVLVLSLYNLATISFIISALAKHHERRQRRERMERNVPRRRFRVPGQQHPHQD